MVAVIVSAAALVTVPVTTAAVLARVVVAVALVMPNKKLSEVTVDSVKNKLKKKEFARKVSREDIQRGVEELGVPLEEHIATVLGALQEIAEKIGL